MAPDEKPKIVDLGRYKQAAKARAAQAAAAQRKAARQRPSVSGQEPVLGSRPRAGVILILLAVVFAALTFGPRFLHG